MQNKDLKQSVQQEGKERKKERKKERPKNWTALTDITVLITILWP